VPSKPPKVAELVWLGDLRFAATVRRPPQPDAAAAPEPPPVVIDSAGIAGPSPVDALGMALAGCMAMDLAHILVRGRHQLRGLKSQLVAERASENPHRLVRASLHFDVEGAVPADAIERAIQLSREKYCSVWHSLREDIVLTVTFDVHE
jgi:putative redox protein